MSSLSQKLFRRKPVVEMEAETGSETGKSELARTIGIFQLTMFGVGATIGTGIFFVLSQAVPDRRSGGDLVVRPRRDRRRALGGLLRRTGRRRPVSGSSYSYAYATIGELPAMVVAGCLLLEYGVSAAAVAVGWSQYLNEFLDNLFGFQIPEALSRPRRRAASSTSRRHPDPAGRPAADPRRERIRDREHGDGADQDRRADHVRGHRRPGWNSNNLADFAPFGLSGITAAAGIIFFSYIGLDAVSTAGEEVKNPHRTMPLAIIVALITVTTLYILVALVAVAAQPSTQFDRQEAGLARSWSRSPAPAGRPPSWPPAR